MNGTQWYGILKAAGQMTQAAWAGMFFCDEDGWHVLEAWGLRAAARRSVQSHLERSAMRKWLNGALASGRVRSRQIAGERWYAIPCVNADIVFLVASQDELPSESQQIWRLTAKTCQAAANDVGLMARKMASGIADEIPVLAPHSADALFAFFLARMVASVGALGGWMGVISGDRLTLRVGTPVETAPVPFTLPEKHPVRQVLHSQQPLVVARGQSAWADLPMAEEMKAARAAILLPLVNGRRVLAVLALWCAREPARNVVVSLRNLGLYLAIIADSLLMLEELSGHTRRLGLLNDFMRTVSLASSLDESVERVFALLRRTFGTPLVALALLSADGSSLRLYRMSGKKVVLSVENTDDSSLAEALLKMKRLQTGGVRSTNADLHVYNDVLSRLWAPMRQRGEIIGAIILESVLPDAFTDVDKNLLVVIASHLSGVVAYGRLLEHAESHARNMELIHRVVQQVIGLTNLQDVAQIAADALTESFKYDSAAVFFQGEALSETLPETVRGISGEIPEFVRRRLMAWTVSSGRGLTGKVFASGESILCNDVTRHPEFQPIEGWPIRSELCVPIYVDGRVVGLIDVENKQEKVFSTADLLVLESLAAVLGGVVTMAWQYQRLQNMVVVLQETKQELQAHIQAQEVAENKLLQAAKLAAVGEMAAGVAHELNNPLTTVIGFTELSLQNEALPESARQDLGLVLQEAQRARDVVRRLLDFSRQTETTYARTDLNTIITDVLALMAHLLKNHGVILQQNLKEDLPWVRVDRNQMKQVFLNLFHNAINAMPGGGQLTVSTDVAERRMQLWARAIIEDTGEGIPPKMLSKIFEPFFTTRSGEGGTGLGLSVTYGIVTAHKGTIEVSSEVGQGTRFIIWLPLGEGEEASG